MAEKASGTLALIVTTFLAAVLCLPLAACAQGQDVPADMEEPAADAEVADVTSVAYLGPAGTYTEEATKLFFGDNDELLAQETVAQALELVTDGSAAYAVIPQENTLGGPVTDYIDALLTTEGVSVVGEVVLPIRQTLMGLPGTDLAQVGTVYSHKQGLAQSAAWLDENLPGAERVERPSTAAAAQEVAEGADRTVAAIAAPGAADLYGLEVLQENVSQSEANVTRFYVVSRTPNGLEGYDRLTLVASISADELPALLEEVCVDGTELVSVHDRPEGSALGRYRYVVELAREVGFSSEEIERISGIQGVACLGAYGSMQG
ncbi:MAG: hypothetical protein E7Z98_06715 [Olsenella sp.]|nr:hypothetical protein [Olsenella sp.]